MRMAAFIDNLEKIPIQCKDDKLGGTHRKFGVTNLNSR